MTREDVIYPLRALTEKEKLRLGVVRQVGQQLEKYCVERGGRLDQHDLDQFCQEHDVALNVALAAFVLLGTELIVATTHSENEIISRLARRVQA
jgi:hypothetical protein